MNLLADEGVDGPIVEKLRQEGHDVVYIAEASSLPEQPGFENGQMANKSILSA